MMYCYTLKDIQEIERAGYDYRIDDTTLELLDKIKTNLSTISKRNKSQPQWEILRVKPKKVAAIASASAAASVPHSTNKIFKASVSETTDINDLVRSILNKLSEQSFLENVDTLLPLAKSNPDLHDTVFVICSTNRFFSKLYADLYTTLLNDIPAWKPLLKTKMHDMMQQFTVLFQPNVSVPPDEDPDFDSETYEEICKRNLENETKKSIAQFIVHLRTNGCLSGVYLTSISESLLMFILSYAKQENYDQSIDIVVEILAIFYDPTLMEKTTLTIDGNPVAFNKMIKTMAKSKKSNFKSLSTRSIFKFMDMAGM